MFMYIASILNFFFSASSFRAYRLHVRVGTSSAENQKGVNAVQQCSVENQKGAIAIDFVQQ